MSNHSAKRPISASSFQFLAGIVLTVFVLVFAMTWWAKTGLMVIVAGIFIYIIFRSVWTIKFHIRLKILMSILSIVFLAFISRGTIQDQYIKDNQVKSESPKQPVKIVEEIPKQIVKNLPPKRSTAEKTAKYESETKAENKKRLIEDLEKSKRQLATLGISEEEKPEVKLNGGVGIQTKVKVKWGLKSRAIFLSYQILQFLISRESNESDVEKKDVSNEDTDNMISYLNDTMNQYSLKFGDKVISIRNEFANEKLRDKDLDKYYKHPNNPIEIRLIVERIEDLAERIK